MGYFVENFLLVTGTIVVICLAVSLVIDIFGIVKQIFLWLSRLLLNVAIGLLAAVLFVYHIIKSMFKA